LYLQVDSLAGKRNDDMHESTRRLLGVLLRFIDGFQATDSIIVAATNRKQDLDAAMLSRCDAIVRFDLPDAECRAAILKLYATHLSPKVCILRL
jgi:SpoVK/Ycf46/Vps4 family AAA+-type ATPase